MGGELWSSRPKKQNHKQGGAGKIDKTRDDIEFTDFILGIGSSTSHT